MTQFQASLIASGDPEPLPTVVELDEGKLVIQSNGQPLGNWPVSDLEFVRVVGGFRVTLDGEVAVLKLTESDEFNAELRKLNEGAAESVPQKKFRKKRERKADVKSQEPVAVASAEPASEKMGAPVLDRPAETPGPGARGQTFFNWMDAKLDVAARRGGKYLPQWVFTRGGVAVGLLLLIAILIFPGPFSAVFLIVAAIGMITSSIALMDQVIATRIFRGGFTPIHGLIGSLVLVLIGLVLASL
ncbi:MAG: hypothetical protein WDZ96_02000 [Acidimicrobiia bacterium]